MRTAVEAVKGGGSTGLEAPKSDGAGHKGLLAHPAIPYVLPFAIFLALVALAPHLKLDERIEFPLRVGIIAVVLLVFSRRVIDLNVRQLWPTLLVGVLVFGIWVAPDLLIPGYRQHWLFQNSITGSLGSSLTGNVRADFWVLLFRSVRAVMLVAIVEELFWRGWLMRWLVSADFRSVPLGTYRTHAFWITAVLFASEHGPYWDVGLVAGALYNWWMIRTKSLGDCILAHAVTNACLSAFVVLSGRWEYWY